MTAISNLSFTPNIHFNHSIFLPVTLDKTVPVLGSEQGFERVCRLSKLCTLVGLTTRDTTAIPPGVGLDETSVISRPAAIPGAAGSLAQVVQRQGWFMEETVPIVAGFLEAKTRFMGVFAYLEPAATQIMEADGAARKVVVLIESVADSTSGVKIWKSRKLEEEGAGTRVTEFVEGWAPLLLKKTAQEQGAKVHAEQMQLYYTLF